MGEIVERVRQAMIDAQHPQYACNATSDMALAAITAHKAWLSENGWAIVPREPTEAMVIAGCQHENMGDMAGRWRAMIDTAPEE